MPPTNLRLQPGLSLTKNVRTPNSVWGKIQTWHNKFTYNTEKAHYPYIRNRSTLVKSNLTKQRQEWKSQSWFKSRSIYSKPKDWTLRVPHGGSPPHLESDVINDPSARSPNRFFIEMRLNMNLLVATNDMKDAGGQNPLDAQSLRIIEKCLPRCFAWADEAFE